MFRRFPLGTLHHDTVLGYRRPPSTKRQSVRENRYGENERSTLISFISFFIIAFFLGQLAASDHRSGRSNYALTVREGESGDWMSPQICVY